MTSQALVERVSFPFSRLCMHKKCPPLTLSPPNPSPGERMFSTEKKTIAEHAQDTQARQPY